MTTASHRFSFCLRETMQASLLVVTILCFGIVFFSQAVAAQTFTVLHSFAPQGDGYEPQSGLIMDARGNLYGTTFKGGQNYDDGGVAYKVSHAQGGWVSNLLTEFNPGQNGYAPQARLTFGPNSATIYGTTEFGGNDGCSGYGCGTVFELTPRTTPPPGEPGFDERTTIYRFSGPDGNWPLGEVIFDPNGNIFGTTPDGGTHDGGTVFELARVGTQWRHSVLYNFTGFADGAQPLAGLIMDSAGNLYGTNDQGGGSCYCGVVFELSPSSGGWTYHVLHTFEPPTDGGWPYAGLTLDAAGNLYGTTSGAGPAGGGTVFELSPVAGGWNFQVIYALSEQQRYAPQGGVVLDAAGNVYATTSGGGQYFQGSVFKLIRQNGTWVFTLLHDFQGIPDGAVPKGNLLLDAAGNLYGTASGGGEHASGSVWEISPQ